MSGESSAHGWSSRRRSLLLLAIRLLARMRPGDREKVFVYATLVGMLGAGIGQLFKHMTTLVQWLFTGGTTGGYVEVFATLPLWQRILVPTAGGLFAGLALLSGNKLMRNKATDYMEAVALGDGVVRARPSLVKSLAALFSIASGEAIGREGPLVQLAAMLASLVGRFRRLPPAQLRLIVACGAAAGIASAYHAPLGGALFVAEIVLGTISMESFGPLLLASVSATLTTKAFEGTEPLYSFPAFSLAHPQEILAYAVLGAFVAIVAYFWMHALHGAKRGFAALHLPIWLRLMSGGLIVGLLAAWHPEVTGNGGSVIRELVAGDYGPSLALILVLAKVMATCAAFGSGAVGGVFTPSLFLGAFSGWLVAWGAGHLFPGWVPEPTCFALVGMGAFLAAAVRAPVMAIVMLLEMTMAYSIMLPLMVATVVAYAVSRALDADSLYAESLRAGPRSVFDRDLSEVSVGDISRSQETSVLPSARFGEVAREFLRVGSQQIWVVDSHNHCLGPILMADVQPFLKDPVLADAVIALDLVRHDIPALAAAKPIADVLAVFAKGGSDRIPVEDADGQFKGSLSREDLFLTISELTRRAGVRATN